MMLIKSIASSPVKSLSFLSTYVKLRHPHSTTAAAKRSYSASKSSGNPFTVSPSPLNQAKGEYSNKIRNLGRCVRTTSYTKMMGTQANMNILKGSFAKIFASNKQVTINCNHFQYDKIKNLMDKQGIGCSFDNTGKLKIRTRMITAFNTSECPPIILRINHIN